MDTLCAGSNTGIILAKGLVESGIAEVALKKGMTLDGKELMEFCKQNMDCYKAPKSVEIVDALPKNAAGKIMKTELRKRYKESQKG